MPIATLIYWVLTGVSTDSQLQALPRAAMNSMLIGFYTAIVATLAALPVAILAVRYRRFLFSRIIERISYLGYALPGIVIALSFVFLGARYLTPFYQTLPLMIFAMAIRFIPFGVGAARTSLLQISPRLEESSRSLGRSSFATTLRITVPLAWPGISAGAALVFLSVLKGAADHVAAQSHRIRHPRHRNLDRDRWRRVWPGRGAGARADRDLRDSHPAAGAANLPARCIR